MISPRECVRELIASANDLPASPLISPHLPPSPTISHHLPPSPTYHPGSPTISHDLRCAQLFASVVDADEADEAPLSFDADAEWPLFERGGPEGKLIASVASDCL